jgi:hypothetical protein
LIPSFSFVTLKLISSPVLEEKGPSAINRCSRKALRGVVSQTFCKNWSAKHADSFDLHSKEHAMPTYDNLPKISQHFKGKWYNKMVEDLRLAGMADRTV